MHLLTTCRHKWRQFIVHPQPPPPSSPSPQGAFTSVVAMLRGAGVDDVISTNTFVPLHPTSFFLLAPQLPACLPAFAI